MEKLELRRDKERAAEEQRRDNERAADDQRRAAEQLQNQQLMIQMMQNMFQPGTQQQQTPGTTPVQLPSASSLPSGIPPIASTSTPQRSDADELAASMDRTKLNTDESEKKRKTDDRMNMDHENVHPKLPLPDGSQQ